MSDSEAEFIRVCEQIDDAAAGKLFGKACYKISGKAFVCFFQDEMVFKLSDEQHAKALKLKGAQLFDPSGKGRPMREWVQVPFAHKKHWPDFAANACAYVGGV